MCGIAGFLNLDRSAPCLDVLKNMASELAHRGPDGFGMWSDSESGIALAHRRLSILDLSENGKQPMISNSGNLIITFNGEIYNHLDIREQLGIGDWKGTSDTETLLCAVEAWGFLKTLNEIKGMFAFAIWDRKKRKLLLARDRVGEKPLYYCFFEGKFVFASELKAIRRIVDNKLPISMKSLDLYMRYGYIPGENSIYENTYKLKAASYVEIDRDRFNFSDLKVKSYWSMAAFFLDGLKAREENPVPLLELKEHLSYLIKRSVKRQMISDVPLGAFLSSGIDSSLVVSIMQACSSRPVNTFTVGYHEFKNNEAPTAKLIANYLGTNHSEIYVTSSDILKLVPDVSKVYDEPFGDSSLLPSLLLSRFVKNSVTVALTGDGGDEFFCGYQRYLNISKYNSSLLKIPYFIRSVIEGGANFNRLIDFLDSTKFTSVSNFSKKMRKIITTLPHANSTALYLELLKQWPPEVLNNDTDRENYIRFDNVLEDSFPNFFERMMLYDSLTYLTDDILVKVDRASMSTGLETRAPLLDSDVIEYSFKIPVLYKTSNKQLKIILNDILKEYIPESLISERKKGFSVPIDQWLRKELFNWANDYLSSDFIKKQGIFNHKLVSRRWKEHAEGIKNWRDPLWTILMFQSWLDEQG